MFNIYAQFPHNFRQRSPANWPLFLPKIQSFLLEIDIRIYLYTYGKETTSCATQFWASEVKIDVGNKESKRRLRRATPCFETPGYVGLCKVSLFRSLICVDLLVSIAGWVMLFCSSKITQLILLQTILNINCRHLTKNWHVANHETRSCFCHKSPC